MGLQGILSAAQSKVQIILNGNTVLQFDCSEKETHSRQSPPTEFEVENGETISDHQTIKPFSLKLTGIITDSPVGSGETVITTVATAFVPPIGIVGAAAGLAIASALDNSDSPSIAAYTQLLQLQALRLPVNILTSLSLYKNMFMSSISVPRDARNSGWLYFDVEFIQLLLVSPQTINIAKYSNADVGAGQAAMGKQEAQNSQILQKFNNGNTAAFNAAGVPKPSG